MPPQNTRWTARGTRAVRVANCSGGRNDAGYQMKRQAELGDVDFITGDYLAEVSLAENAEAMRAGKHDGWFPTCWEGIEQSLDTLLEKRIKVIVNGGGLNPGGLARKIQQQISDKGSSLNVAYVSGDDLYEPTKQNLRAGILPPHLDSGNEEIRLDHLTESLRDDKTKPLIAANAYLGARAIHKALEAGSDIIICGRVSDASPVIGAAWWWFGWEDTHYDKLAGALIAGHMIECSGYVTGGNFAGFGEFDLDTLIDVPFGIAEIDGDGSSVITMHDTGKGVINEDIIRCQFLYELQGSLYLNSDVTADISNIAISEIGRNRVRISGIRGTPPPPTTKLAMFYCGGYQCQLLLNATGYDTEKKWDLQQRQIEYALKKNGVLDKFDVLEFQRQALLLPNDSYKDERANLDRVGTPQADPKSQLKSTTYLRVFAQASDVTICAMLKSSWAEFVMQHFSGLHYSLDFRTTVPVRYIAYYPALYPQDSLKEGAHVLNSDGSVKVSLDAGHPPAYASMEKRTNFDASNSYTLRSSKTTILRLGDIALGRSGDKGANINFGIFPRNAAIWPWFREFLSRAKLQELIGEDWRDEYFIERMEFPNIKAVHFVIYGILGRGSSSSVLLDSLGKGFCDYIRDKYISIPTELLETRSSGIEAP